MVDDSAVASPELDLFGQPVAPLRERRGRPSFAKTEQNQRDVATLSAAGWTQSRIAGYIGCDEKTLRKNFSRELRAGADLVEGQCLQVLVQKMREGHTPSIRMLFDRLDAGRARAPLPNQDTRDKPEKLGKKEAAAQAAADVPESWGDVIPRDLH